jgi:alpha-1,2-mannosyltransferase
LRIAVIFTAIHSVRPGCRSPIRRLPRPSSPFRIWQIGLALAGVGSLLVAAHSAVVVASAECAGRIAKTVAVTAVCLWLEPVDSTFFFGQINLILMALVLADFALPNSSRGKGVATGIAAAIKLTPLIFLPYLWFTGRRRAAVTGLATVLVTIAGGFIVLPASSADYWSGQFAKAGDNPVRLVNQSLNGSIRRLVHNSHTAQLSWLVAAVVLGCTGLVIAAVAGRNGHELLGICVCAVTGLLVSPISWTHHYVWVLPVLVLAVSSGSRAARVLFGSSVIVLFGWWPIPGGLNGGFSGTVALNPSGLLRHVNHNNGAELHWDFSQTIAGNAYVLAGLVFLIVAATRCGTPAVTGPEERRKKGRTRLVDNAG